jgi:FkbM family methyltransferase
MSRSKLKWVHRALRFCGYELQKRDRLALRYGEAIAQIGRLVRSPEPVIFDVGAFVGETVLAFMSMFPKARIFAFEPCADSFDRLRAAVGEDLRVAPIRAALGASQESRVLHRAVFGAASSLLAPDKEGDRTWPGLLDTEGDEVVEVTTLDEFASSTGIERIDILKVDVQGAGHLVLAGGERMLREGRVDLICLEILTMPAYEGQLGLSATLAWLEERGYRLHGLYELSTIGGQLRQLDAIFVRSGVCGEGSTR